MLRASLKATNADVANVIADVFLKDEIQVGADATIEWFGKVNFLVNSASMAGFVSSGSPSYNVNKFGVVVFSKRLRTPMADSW